MTHKAEMVRLIVSAVEQMQEAAYHAQSWARPGTCGIGDEFPCRHRRCVENAGHYAKLWASRAVHFARRLEYYLGEERT